MTTDGFSIIIPTYNTLPYLKLCLESLDKYSTLKHEVIIYVDGSTDGTQAYLREKKSEFIQGATNQGVCTATNIAVSKATQQYLFLINDDVFFGPDWDVNLIKHVSPNMVISGVYLEPGSIPVAPCYLEYNCGRVWSEFDENTFLKACQRFQHERGGKTKPAICYPFLISKILWEEVGGLDPRFNPGPGSDPDFFYRLALSPRRIKMIQAQDVLFYHFSGRSSRFAKDAKQPRWKWSYFRWRNRRRYKKKWGKVWDFKFGEVPKVAKKILLFVWGGIGNMLLFTPTLVVLRRQFPEAKIFLCVQKSKMLEVIGAGNTQGKNQLVDGVISLDSIRGWEKFRLIGMLRSFAPDIALSNVTNPRLLSSLLSFLSGAKIRIGKDTKRRGFLNTIRIEQKKNLHEVESNLNLLRPLGVTIDDTHFFIQISEADRRFATYYLENQGLGEDYMLIGIHPGSSFHQSFKRWDKDRFAELVQKLSEMKKIKCLLFGGKEEENLVKYIQEKVNKSVSTYIGNGELCRTAALIERCNLFVSNDTSLMHLAAALKVPVMAIFGPTIPEKNRPYGEGHTVIYKSLPCRPCYKFKKIKCKKNFACLKEITVEEVFQIAKDKLNQVSQNAKRSLPL
ncbi:MAG: glycosyltransferase family 9 protein [Candidatus Edwardsbacteria bacterium]